MERARMMKAEQDAERERIAKQKEEDEAELRRLAGLKREEEEKAAAAAEAKVSAVRGPLLFMLFTRSQKRCL